MSTHKSVTVATCSYNKMYYLAELKAALDRQTLMKDFFQWRILDNSLDGVTRQMISSWDEDWIDVTLYDFSRQEREERFVHPVLLNRAVAEAQGEFFIHISDDDLPDPKFLEALYGFLRFNEDKSFCYVPMIRTQLVQGEWKVETERIPNALVVFSERVSPIGNLDGNCVMGRVEALRQFKWDESWKNASYCDGVFLQQVAPHYKIWPASKEALLNHRMTELSTFQSSDRSRSGNSDHLREDIFGPFGTLQ